jgi:hypothetical protein
MGREIFGWHEKGSLKVEQFEANDKGTGRTLRSAISSARDESIDEPCGGRSGLWRQPWPGPGTELVVAVPEPVQYIPPLLSVLLKLLFITIIMVTG